MAAWLRRNILDILFMFFFLLIATGFFFVWWPLGLIVPGVIGCGLMIWSRIAGTPLDEPADDDAEREERSGDA